jgi:hypothetical protein
VQPVAKRAKVLTAVGIAGHIPIHPQERSMRSTRLFAVALLIAVGVAACGSSSKGASSDNSSSTTAAAGNSASTSAPSSAGASTTTTIKISGSGSSNFCAEARPSQNAFRAKNPTSLTATSLKQLYQNLGPELAKVEAIAPSAIKPDFATFIQAFTPYLNALKAANYDFTKINFASLTAMDSAGVKAASAHITAYLTQVCHIAAP